jgi:serine/threonine protein kinase/tetratricopeptide (TPR) repeat protein
LLSTTNGTSSWAPTYRTDAGGEGSASQVSSRVSYDEAMSLSPGDQIGAYVVDGWLGRGGMADVYVIHDRTSRERRALKVLKATSVDDWKRLAREGRVQTALDHPNVLSVIEVLESVRGAPALVLPLIEGPGLDVLLARYRPTVPESLALAHAIARGLAHAHSRGVVHRDLKPSNVLLALPGPAVVPLLADFGLVKADVEEGLTHTGVVMGTPAYSAPEQLLDAASVDARADVWSLGVVLFELLTGALPFAGHTFRAVLSAQHTTPDLSGIPRAVRGLMRRVLSPDREDRPADAGVVATTLAGLCDAGGLQSTGLVTAVRQAPRQPIRSHPPSLGAGWSLLDGRASAGGSRGDPLRGYSLGKRIGSGATGSVWQAERDGSRPVAMKLVAIDPEAPSKRRRAVRTEIRALASIDHPNVVPIFDFGEITHPVEDVPAGSVWIAMELAAAHLGAIHHWEGVRTALVHVLSGLARAHSVGVVHRDIKPANVLWYPDTAEWKVGDFGIAAMAEVQTGERVATAGTPSYMAPEQISGTWRDQGPWTDLYAVGCLAWQLTTGAPPFPGPSIPVVLRKHLYELPPAFKPTIEVPRDVLGWMRRLLQKRPENRFMRAADALAALRAISGAPIRARAHPPSGPAAGGRTMELDDDLTRTMTAGPAGDADGWDWPDTNPSPIPPLPVPSEPPRDPLPREVDPNTNLALHRLKRLPLVGRQAEQAAAWDALRETAEVRATRMLVLRGAGGCGKTRLGNWLCSRASELGVAQVFEASQGDHRLQRLAKRALRLGGLEGSALQARVTALMPDRADDVMALIKGRQDPQIYETLTALVTKLAAGRVAVVWLDDAADDPGLLEWVDHARTLDLGPVLFVVAVADSAEAPAGHVVELGPLTDGDVSELLRQRLRLAPEVVGHVVDVAAGDPEVAIQLVDSWLRRDMLQPGPLGLTARGAHPLDVPDAVARRRSRHAWLHDLPGDTLESLVIASLIGPWVEDEVWERCCKACGTRPAWDFVERLLEARVATQQEGGWAFTSGPARAALRDRLPDRWRQLALECGRVLDHQEQPELAGRLMLAGGDGRAALPLLDAAARAHSVATRYRAALSALDAWDQAFEQSGGDTNTPRFARALSTRGYCLFKAGNFKASERVAAVLEERCRAHGWPELADALNMQAIAAAFRGDMTASLALAQEVLTIDDAHRSARWEALEHIARAYSQQGQLLEAQMALERALATSRGTERERDILVSIAGLHQMRGELDRALEILQQAQRIGLAFGGRWGDLNVRFELGVVLECMGRYPEARAQFEYLLDEYRNAGRANRVADVVNSLAELDRHTGRLAEAEAGYREVMELYQRMGWAPHPIAHANLGLVMLERGEFMRARPLMDQALELVGSNNLVGWTGVVAGLALPAWVEDADRFHALIATRHDALVSTGHCDADVYKMQRLAAKRAVALDEPDLAGLALNAALQEATALGNERVVADVRRAMSRLA